MKAERLVYWGFGIAKWTNRIISIGALIIVAIGMFLIYRPRPKPTWVGTAGPENVVGRYYGLNACKYALRKTGGDCAQPCTGKEKSPADCGSVVHVNASK